MRNLFLVLALCFASRFAGGQNISIGALPVSLTTGGGGGHQVTHCWNLGPSPGPTPPIDTTGASMIYVGVAFYASGPSTVTDNKGNGSPANVGSSSSLYTYLYTNPSTGTNHIFTPVGGQYETACVSALYGSYSYVPATGANASGSTCVSPITVGSGSALVITQASIYADASGATIDSGFSIDQSVSGGNAINVGLISASLRSTSAGTVSGTFTSGGGLGQCVTSAFQEVGTVTIPAPVALYTLCGETSHTSGCQGATSTVWDTSGNNNDANYVNGYGFFVAGTNMPYVKQWTGGADNGAITTPLTWSNLPPPFTVCFWQNPADLSGTPLPLIYMTSSWDGLYFGESSTSSGFTVVSNGNWSGAVGANGPPLPVNTWSHTCAEWDASGNLYFYLNGALVGTGAGAPAPAGVPTLTINDWQHGHYFTGLESDVRVFNSILTAAQINAIYLQAKH